MCEALETLREAAQRPDTAAAQRCSEILGRDDALGGAPHRSEALVRRQAPEGGLHGDS